MPTGAYLFVFVKVPYPVSVVCIYYITESGFCQGIKQGYVKYFMD